MSIASPADIVSGSSRNHSSPHEPLRMSAGEANMSTDKMY